VSVSSVTTRSLVKWDAAKLDRLLAEAGIDVALISSPHNLRHLLDGYEYFLYARANAIGLSRYQPLLAYVPERLDLSVFVGAGNEAWSVEAQPLWVPDLILRAWSSEESAALAAAELRHRGYGAATVGVEMSYLAADALRMLERELPGSRFVEAAPLLEELRAVKRPEELDEIRAAGEGIVASMLASFEGAVPGMSKREIVERYRTELTSRGLVFDYCLIAVGSDLNRAPSGRTLSAGDVLSLDSGGERGGFVGDMARMAIAGDPTAELEEALAAVDAVQQAARSAVVPGRAGSEIFAAAEQALSRLPRRAHMGFLAHGMGRVTHEVPRLTSTGSPPYPATHAERSLEPGMVLSVETHLADERLGFVKLEDAVIVTDEGHEPVADTGRRWNRLGG
jgi:Xaa-Pro aminopeptidase